MKGNYTINCHIELEKTSWHSWQNTLYADILLFLHKPHTMDTDKAVALHLLPQMINNVFIMY